MSKILALNLKMNFDYNDVKKYVSSLNGQFKGDNVIFFPPTIFLPYFISRDYPIGAQTISEYDNGAHTGELSCTQLKSIGGSYVIIGHSERRQDQKETDEQINLKVKKALANNLKVILCVGETKEEREMLKTTKVLRKEIMGDLKDINSDALQDVIVAYEPIWAIGTGAIPLSKDIKDAANFIVDTAINLYNFKPLVLYGGSVNEKNIGELIKIDEISGFLVGGASLDINKILKMKEVVEK